MKIRELLRKAERDLVKRSYEQKRRKALEQLGEYFYRLFLSGKVEEVPPEIGELIEKLRYIDGRIVKLEHDED